MKKIFNKFKVYFIFIGTIILSTVILSLFNTIGVSSSITNIVGIIIFILLFFMIGFIHGKKCDNNGYLQGLKIGIILCLILFIASLFILKLSFSIIIYYSILILSSVFGSTIGINKKH